MKKITFPVSRTKAVWELLFELTFVSPSPDWWAILCLLASKLVSFSQPLMLIYYGTSCSSWSDLASYFTPMACPVGEGEFFISCYAFFGLVQFFVGLLLFKFFDIWGRLRKNGCSSEYSFLSLSLHAFLLFSTRVLTHVGISAFSYSVFQVLNPGTGFDGYKHLTTWTEVTAQSYVAIALTLVGTLEVLCAAGLFTILCQDRSVRGTSFWSANTFYHALTELCFTMVIQIEFFFNSSVRLSYIIRVLMRGTVFLALALYTRYSHYLVDMTEFFFAVLELELNAFVLAFDLLDYTFNDYVSYPIMMIPFALFVCIIRSYSSWQVRPESPKNEAAVMDSVERLLSLAKNKDYRSITTLTGLLVMHSQRCQTEGCDCKNLMQKLISPGNSTRGLAADPPMSENTVVYLTDVNVPEAVTKGMVKETLTILIGELASHVAKGEELETQMAEVAFYYFRNHYTALKQIAQVEAGKPRLTIRQRLYNLKRTISTGFERWAEEEDPEKTLLAIRYLKYYHKFLDRVEDATEATIKFWSIVTEDAPSSNRLNELGKILFDCKFKTTKTVERLSQIASNNVEFLVRYGLFLRLVMHDLVISEQVFQKIVSLHIAMESNAADKLAQGLFSVFRFEASIMLVLAKLEHTGTATVAEINTHVEQVLGYTRRDLIGCSVTNLMPAPIAQKHESYVSKFYKTMKTTNINVHRARYVKTKDGMYVMCRCLTKIVPKLDEKIMLAVFMVPDKRCSYYTTFRREITGKKTGSVLFVPGSYTVMGFTREAMSLLRVSEEHLRELMDTITLFDMFPWTQRPEFLEKLFTNEGKVIEYHHSHAMSLNKETDGGTNSEQASRTFFWIRLVVEKVNNSPVFVAMVISEIPKAANANYELEPGSNVFFFDSRAKVTQTQAPKHERNIMESKKDASSHRPAWAIISDVASVASMASVATSTQTGSMKTEGGYELSRELQMAGESTQTPTAIKWLCVGMFVMLLVVVGLIIVNAYVALQEISSLATRFDLIQAYHLRYRGTMLVTDMARIYSQFLIGGNLTVLNKYTRIRNGYLCDYNVATRKLLFNQKLDYDDEIVTTVDMDYYQMNASFSHAVFIMINTNQEYTAVNSSTTLANCRNTKRRTTVCEYIVEMTTYAYTVGFFGLRVEQDSVSRRLESELTSMSRQGETVQYMITGICVGLITASACIILPIFIWVIKDKSYVLAIFSDITQKEASRIITDSRKLDIKNLHYKKRWIETAGDSHESFWKKLIAEHRKGFGRKVDDRELDKEVVVRENSGDLNFKNESKSPAEEKKAEEESKEESDDEEAEEIRNQKEKEKLKKEAEEAAKKVKRRKKLSEIDYALRRKFILRLLLVVFIFYGYAGFAFYFNNYVHENNAQASTYLFAFCKRSIYLHNLNFVLLEALGGYNKTLAGRNNGTNGQLFMQDIADEMMRIEAQAKEFQKTASRSLYGGYLDQLDIFEGPGFCNESDKYTDIGKFLGNCTQLYKGPMNNGLAAGVAYFLDLHINVAQALIALNTSSSTAVSQFATTNSSLGNISPSLTYPLSFAIGALLTTFYTCAVSFFLLVKKVIYGTSIGFVCVFVTVYVTVFSRFISILSEEIWHTRGMLNMIPAEIIEKNLSVREQVWKRKGMK